MLIWVLLATIIIIIHLKIHRIYHKYWIQKGIRYVRPWPFLGIMSYKIIWNKTYLDVIKDICETFLEQRYFGCYRYLTPLLVVRDLNLISCIVEDRNSSEEMEGISLRWIKSVRFIRGLGIFSDEDENVFPLIKIVAEQFTVHYIDKHSVEINTIEVTSKIANDILAFIFFEEHLDSFEDPENKFYLRNKEFLNSQKSYYANDPNLFTHSDYDFYKNFLEVSKLNSLLGNRILTILQKQNIEDITVQDLLYSFYKHQAISISMCYLIYELAINQDVQHKLRRQIDKAKAIYGPQIPYCVINQIPYLEMVILEHLRKRPYITIEETKLETELKIISEKKWEGTVIMDIDTSVLFPILTIHYDPKNYHQPDAFDPERFNEKNREKIKPFSYIPFGIQSQNHRDHKFMVTELKIFITYLLSNFFIAPSNNNNRWKKSLNLTVDEISKIVLKSRI